MRCKCPLDSSLCRVALDSITRSPLPTRQAIKFLSPLNEMQMSSWQFTLSTRIMSTVLDNRRQWGQFCVRKKLSIAVNLACFRLQDSGENRSKKVCKTAWELRSSPPEERDSDLFRSLTFPLLSSLSCFFHDASGSLFSLNYTDWEPGTGYHKR